MRVYLVIEGENAGDTGELVRVLSALSQNPVQLPQSQQDLPKKTPETNGRSPVAIKGTCGFVSKYNIPGGKSNPQYNRFMWLCRTYGLSYQGLIDAGVIQPSEPVKNPEPTETKPNNQAQPESTRLPIKCRVSYKDPKDGRERTGTLSRQYPNQGNGIVLPDGTAGEALEIGLDELQPIEAANGGV